VINGRDPEVLNILLNFYSHPEGKILDVTCNKRRMWKGIDIDNVVFSDIDISVDPDIVSNFCELPFPDSKFSIIVFDPPHLPAAAGSIKSLKHFVKNYGLNNTVSGDNIDSIFVPFLFEAKRILKDDGLIFAKLADFVHNHNYQWTLVSFINAIRSINGLTPTDLIIKCDPSAGNLSSSKWENCYHARRSFCWWVIVRKGKCEPDKNNIKR